METYINKDVLNSNEENMVKEFFALGQSRYSATYQQKDREIYYIFSHIKDRLAFCLDYEDNKLLAPQGRALNPLLRQYAELEELEFTHSVLTLPTDANRQSVYVVKLRNDIKVDDVGVLESLKIREKSNIDRLVNDYITWATATGTTFGSRWAYNTTEQVSIPNCNNQNCVECPTMTINVPTIQPIEAQELTTDMPF